MHSIEKARFLPTRKIIDKTALLDNKLLLIEKLYGKLQGFY